MAQSPVESDSVYYEFSEIIPMFKFFTLANASVFGLISLVSFHLAGTPAIAAPRPQQVKVFFPKNPGQQGNLGYVEPVWR